MDYKKKIIKELNALSGSRSPYEVFCDWVKCMALSIQNASTPFNHDALWMKREEDYIRTIKPYGADGERICTMYGMLVMALEDNISDVLGEIYMEAGLGNKNTGQFFTPFPVSYMCAKMSLMGENGSRVIRPNEPSCGGGGMIIATAKVLKERGINYQKCLDVVAQDLDWKAVYMCYVQLSLLGIRAEVVQGDTLINPYMPGSTEREHIFYTPRRMGMIL